MRLFWGLYWAVRLKCNLKVTKFRKIKFQSPLSELLISYILEYPPSTWYTAKMKILR
jgi:hypothetical protein